jgi:hypothetical protein
MSPWILVAQPSNGCLKPLPPVAVTRVKLIENVCVRMKTKEMHARGIQQRKPGDFISPPSPVAVRHMLSRGDRHAPVIKFHEIRQRVHLLWVLLTRDVDEKQGTKADEGMIGRGPCSHWV